MFILRAVFDLFDSSVFFFNPKIFQDSKKYIQCANRYEYAFQSFFLSLIPVS